MKFSVVIPTCNRNEALGECLDLLSPSIQKIGPWDYEVVVSDDSRENAAKDLIVGNYPWVKWISGPGRGPAANRNNGARKSIGEWIIFIDDDCLPLRDVIDEYYTGIKTFPNAGALEGSIVADNEKLLKKDLAVCPVNIVGGYFWTANVCVKRELFDSVLGFDEDFILANHEDQLLYNRLKEVTFIPFIATAKVIHPVKIMSLRTRLKSNNKKLRNWLIYCEKCKQPFNQAISQGIKVHLRELILHTLHFHFKNVVVELYTLFVGFPLIIYRASYIDNRIYDKKLRGKTILKNHPENR